MLPGRVGNDTLTRLDTANCGNTASASARQLPQTNGHISDVERREWHDAERPVLSADAGIGRYPRL